MARTPTKTVKPVEVDELDGSKLDDIQNTASALINAQSEESALVNQLLGQAQMADSFAKFSKTVLTSKLAHVKEHKLYRALSGQKNQDGLELSGTWQEFCNLLGFTPEHANESIANLNNFGEEALESMSRMGIGYREMRQFRKLPEDSKQALIEVAKTGDKESFVEFAEEIISKHSKEKEQLTKERDEALADYDAQSELLTQKNQALDAAKEDLNRTKRTLKERTPQEELHALKVEIGGIVAQVTSLFQVQLKEALDVLADFSSVHGQSQRIYMTSLVFDMASQLDALREEYELPEVLEEELDFLSDEAMALAEANIAAAKADAEV